MSESNNIFQTFLAGKQCFISLSLSLPSSLSLSLFSLSPPPSLIYKVLQHNPVLVREQGRYYKAKPSQCIDIHPYISTRLLYIPMHLLTASQLLLPLLLWGPCILKEVPRHNQRIQQSITECPNVLRYG